MTNTFRGFFVCLFVFSFMGDRRMSRSLKGIETQSTASVWIVSPELGSQEGLNATAPGWLKKGVPAEKLQEVHCFPGHKVNIIHRSPVY